MQQKTVFVNLMGRIGNILFQTATALSLAREHNARVVAIPSPTYILPAPDNGKSLLDYLTPYRDIFFKNVEITDELPDKAIVYVEPSFEYRNLPFADNLYLIGFFQSEKYFDVQYIRKEFSIEESVYTMLTERYGYLLKQAPVSINVRRGDYLLQPNHHPVCSLEYYRKCIEMAGADRCFVVTSDDIDWCKNNFYGYNFHFVSDVSPLENLFLQSMCCDHIISNSTFSWWGAWLDPNSNKKVFAPKRWFGRELQHHNTKDLLPEGWIIVDE